MLKGEKNQKVIGSDSFTGIGFNAKISSQTSSDLVYIGCGVNPSSDMLIYDGDTDAVLTTMAIQRMWLTTVPMFM